MKKNNYLNGILTVIALLLGGLLWAQIAEEPIFAQSAVAQSRTTNSNRVPTLPNAAAQRNQIIDGLREVQLSVKAVNRALDNGEFTVRVSNLSEISTSDSRRVR